MLRARIVANVCSDEGACLMCADCGHIFMESAPLTGESEQVDNVQLSRALYYHLCALGRRQSKVVIGHASKPKL